MFRNFSNEGKKTHMVYLRRRTLANYLEKEKMSIYHTDIVHVCMYKRQTILNPSPYCKGPLCHIYHHLVFRKHNAHNDCIDMTALTWYLRNIIYSLLSDCDQKNHVMIGLLKLHMELEKFCLREIQWLLEFLLHVNTLVWLDWTMPVRMCRIPQASLCPRNKN